MGWLAIASLPACDVHGIVGSNVSLDDGGGTGGGTAVVDEGPHATDHEPDDGVGGGSGGGDGDPTTSDAVMFDVGVGDGLEVCLAPQSSRCDHLGDDPWNALGVGCPGDFEADTSFFGDPRALHVLEGTLGTSGVYSPREGERMVILSTGRAADLPRTHEQLGCSDPQLCPSTGLAPGAPLPSLPVPIDVRPVDAVLTCADEPELVGGGDCSNTLFSEWDAGTGAYDYAELRMRAKVPLEANALVYEFAFFSAEYPLWTNQDSLWNDMYVAWLESEAWTGNVSFDELGHPISTNGVFLDYLDADSPLCTEDPCVAPELDGFAMDGHAGTRWLETIAPVVPGEEIELVLAIFDLTDAFYDTAVVLDGVHWGCTDQPPVTAPAG